MNKSDFVRIIGSADGDEYTPLAGMLQNGYGFAGYFNSRLNQDLQDSVIIMNVRLVDLREKANLPGHPRIGDFNEFAEEIVMRSYRGDKSPGTRAQDPYGKSVPLAALNLDQIAIIYPVRQINKLMAELQGQKQTTPTFLDFDNKSVILKTLRTKLW